MNSLLRHLGKVTSDRLMLSKNLYLFIVGMFTSFSLIAQDELYPIVDDLKDMSLGSYRSVYQGKDSLWVGTDEGLLRVQGKYVEHFHSGNSPITSRVNDIIQDDEGNIWMSTNADSVVMYNPSKKSFSHFSQQDGLDSTRCDFFTLSGKQVFVTCNKGMYSIDIYNNEVEHHLTETSLFEQYNTAFNTISSDKDGHIWFVADDDTLYRYDPHIGHAQQVYTNGVEFSGKTLLLWDSKDRLWIANQTYLYKLTVNSNDFEFEELHQDIEYSPLYALVEDQDGGIWGGGSSLLKYSESREKFVYSDALHPLFKRERSIIGYITDLTFGENKEILLVSSNQFVAIPSSGSSIRYFVFNDNILSGVSKRVDSLDNGTSIIHLSGGILAYDHLSGKSSLLHEAKSKISFSYAMNEEYSFVHDETKEIYLVHHDTGVLKTLDAKKLGLPTKNQGVFIEDALIDINHTVYLGIVGDRQGIYVGTLEGGFENIFPDIRVYKILKGQNGSVFFAVLDQGIYEYTPNKEWVLWSVPEGVRFTYAYCMLEDESGKVWLCDSDNGLAFLDVQTKSISYVKDEPLLNAKGIYGAALGPAGYIWLVTNNRIIRFSGDSHQAISLTRENGVVDNNFGAVGSVHRISPSEIIFGSSKYGYIINVSSINKRLNQRLAAEEKANIVSLKVLTKEASEMIDRTEQLYNIKGIRVPLIASYSDFLFTFKFAISNFIERDNYQFEYRLLGLNNSWLPAEQDTATFSTLPSGDYTLEVRAIDSRSSAKQPITQLPIRVLPPYWLTTQAYVLYVFLILLSFYAIFRFRTRQLTQANLILEKSVAERTSELSKSNEQISSLLAQKESLFANVSHEFRTPLTLILGPMSELRSKQLDEKDVRKFDMMHRNTQRLVQLVEQILELTRLDTAVESPKQVYAIDDAVSILVNSFKPLAELKGQQLLFSSHCPGGLELTKDALEKILYNLLSNAIKYSPEGGKITVTGRQVDDIYQLSIQDTGVGIPEDELDNIFERFTRLEKTAEQLGSGLGLAVVKELVKANKGSIEVSSELNQGTTFTLTFPLLSDFDASQVSTMSDALLALDSASELVTQTQEIPIADNKHSSETHTKPVLLVIEDNADMRTYIQQSMKDDYDCVTANNGQQGIDKAIEVIPDIILSDLMMPLKGGFDVVDTLRNNELTAHIPITLLTAKGDDASRLTGWQKTVDDYIAKPFNVEELKLRLSRLLSVRDIVKKRVTQQLNQNPISDSQEINTAELDSTEQDKVPISFNTKRDEQFYNKLIQVIADNYSDSEFGRGQAARELAVSERQLNRKLSAIVEYNFAELVRKYRLKKAKELLIEGHQIGEVAYDVGFTSPSYFSRCFKAEFAVSPKQFMTVD